MAPWFVMTWPRHRERVVGVLLLKGSMGLVIGFWDGGTGIRNENDAMST
jgi:hypothetical protein